MPSFDPSAPGVLGDGSGALYGASELQAQRVREAQTSEMPQRHESKDDSGDEGAVRGDTVSISAQGRARAMALRQQVAAEPGRNPDSHDQTGREPSAKDQSGKDRTVGGPS